GIVEQRRQLARDRLVAEAGALEQLARARVAPVAAGLEARLLGHPGVEAAAQRGGERLVDAIFALAGVGGEVEGAAGVAAEIADQLVRTVDDRFVLVDLGEDRAVRAGGRAGA